MRKEVVYTVIHSKCGCLMFFYKGKYDTYFLFSSRYKRQVNNYFREGKSIAQIHRNKKWQQSPSLANVIEGQLTRQLKPILKEDGYAR